MTRRHLVIVQWSLVALTLGVFILDGLVEPKGGLALALFFVFGAAIISAAMLSMHLHPPKWFTQLEERRKRR